MAIIDGLKAFFEECPLLKNGRVNVNYLGRNGEDYCIEGVPGEPVVKKYVDGSQLRQYIFVFASREFYGEDEAGNTDTARFYEKLGEWIEERNAGGGLPLLGEGLNAQSIEALTTGYFYSVRAGTARFQLQCRLVYRKEG